VSLRGELFVQHTAPFSPLHYVLDSVFIWHRRIHILFREYCQRFHEQPGFHGKFHNCNTSVVEITIVIRTAFLAGVAQIVVATYPLAPALKLHPNDRLRLLGAILIVT
jgi:hypothetical protein